MSTPDFIDGSAALAMPFDAEPLHAVDAIAPIQLTDGVRVLTRGLQRLDVVGRTLAEEEATRIKTAAELDADARLALQAIVETAVARADSAFIPRKDIFGHTIDPRIWTERQAQINSIRDLI